MPCQSVSLTSAPYSRAQQHKTGRRIRRGPPLAIIVNMTVLALVSNWWSASLYVILSLWQPLSVEHGVSFAFQWLNIASSPSDQGRYLPLLVVWWSAQQGLGCIFVWRITAIVSFGWWWSIVAKCFKVFSFFTSVSIPSPKFQCHLRPPSMITCPLCMPTPRHPPLLWAVAVIFVGDILASNTETVKLGLGWCGTFLLCLLLQMCTSNNTHTSKTQAYRLVIASLLGATPTQTQEHKYKQSISDISSRLL